MIPPASPYAVFKADDWQVANAPSISINKTNRLRPKKRYKSITTQNKSDKALTAKNESKVYVQLAFA